MVCNTSDVSRVSDQIASWDISPAASVGSVLLHPFLPIVCAADHKEVIRCVMHLVVYEFSQYAL